MFDDAQAGYAQTRKQTLSPRGAERALLLDIAGQLGRQDQPFAALAEAVHRNVQLWTTLTVDLGDKNNELPDALKAGLISLANFVLRHSAAVLRDGASPDVLADINRQVAAGLVAPAVDEAA